MSKILLRERKIEEAEMRWCEREQVLVDWEGVGIDIHIL